MTNWIRTGERLGLYGRQADEEFWAKHWRRINVQQWLNWARKDKRLVPSFEHYLPPSGKILDVGCGLGQYVAVLSERGHDIEGIDFSEEVIRLAKEAVPDLPVKVGDALNLPYPDNHFDAILSIGVVEHFEEGPEKAIREAHRVLKEKGVLLIAVPHYNGLRQLKNRLGFYGVKNEGKFYQYAFTKREFNETLKRLGFRTIDVMPYNARKGLRDEVAIFQLLSRFLSAKRADGGESTTPIQARHQSRLVKAVNHVINLVVESPIMRSIVGHMILLIAKKEGRLHDNS